MRDGLVLDLGCGSNKVPGTVGLDVRQVPGVDHVVDIMKSRWPIDDNSVDGIVSTHMLEHVDHGLPIHHFLREVGRVCKEGATIEIWTPHVRGNGAFLPGHTAWISEYMWMLLCAKAPNVWHESMRGAWLLNEIRFHVYQVTIDELARAAMPLDFAVRHLWGVIQQFGIFAEFTRTPREKVPELRMTVAGNDRRNVIRELPVWGT
jgi:SAM-dependent methyltransferase